MALRSSDLFGKKIIITGHTGFKGAWLTLMLNKIGAEITGISLPNENVNSTYMMAKISNLVSNEYFIDIRNRSKLRDILIKTKPDYIFHLAAQSLVIRSYNDPIETFTTNIVGTINLLEASLSLDSLRGITISTTDKVYKNKNFNIKFIEGDELGGSDPYSASKVSVELISYSMAENMNTLKIPISTVRAGNVVGAGDWAENRLIPDLVRAFSSDTPFLVRHPLATRPFQHVLDCLYGYILIAEKHLSLDSPEKFSTYNFGSSTSLSVREVIGIFERVYGQQMNIKVLANNYHEFENLALNTDKAKLILGWKPFFSPTQAIENTVEWYLNLFSSKNKEITIEMQVINYLSRIYEM